MQQHSPTLASGCARATTAAESRFRIDYRDSSSHSSLVIALDSHATELMRGLESCPWHGGRFLAFEDLVLANGNGAADAILRASDGRQALLSTEIDGADVVIMLATSDGRADAASTIGDASATRWIMSAAIVIAEGGQADDVVAALRPNAMVLMIIRSAHDVVEILSALRV